MKRKNFLLLFVMLFTGLAGAQSVTMPLESFLNSRPLKNAVVAYHIIDLRTGKTVASHEGKTLMVSASTLKTLYVFSALDDYGTDYTFKTDLLYCGKIEDGVLSGDLILRSGGDPTFGSKYVDEDTEELTHQMFEAVQKAGIHTIKGNVVLQVNGHFYPVHGSWPLEDTGDYYGAGYWGFNCSTNTFKIYLQTHPQTGVPVQVHHTEPDIPGLKLHSRVTTAPAGTGDNAYIYADPMCYERYIFGTIPVGDSLFAIKGAIPNPPVYYAGKLKSYLQARDIRIDGVARVDTLIHRYNDEKILWSKKSVPLVEVGRQTLNYSKNMFSEALARMVIEKGRPARGYMDKDSINAYFRNKGFRLMDLEDGSGLAPDNLIAPVEFTKFFYRIYKNHGVDYLRDILPHAGEDGYAKYFMRGMKYQSRVWVKSGSVSKVQNYVGIFRGRSGRYYAFAFMINHFNAPRKEVKKQIQSVLNHIIVAL